MLEKSQVSVTKWKNNARAALTLTFDDGYRDTWEYSLRILVPLGVKATHYVVAGAAGGIFQGKKMASWAEWREAVEAGFEVAPHTLSHCMLAPSFVHRLTRAAAYLLRGNTRIPLTTRWKRLFSAGMGEGPGAKQAAEFARELEESKRIVEHETGVEVLSFSYPGGWHNAESEELVKAAGYLSARSSDPGYNVPGKMNRHALKTQMWHKFTRSEEANRWVDRAVESGAWLIETYHLLGETNPSGHFYFTDLRSFSQHLDYIAQKDIWLDTQQNVAKYLLERESSKLQVVELEEKALKLFLTHELDPRVFDAPLTLLIQVPEGCNCLKINGTRQPKIIEPGAHILLDLVPNKDVVILEPG
jgi:peptidoglycan/xylan/chitin deacetylase (PgdA/CDA1 family)